MSLEVVALHNAGGLFVILNGNIIDLYRDSFLNVTILKILSLDGDISRVVPNIS